MNTNTPKDPCPECKGSGHVYRKVWTQGPNVPNVHPAILAGRPAYRTVATFDCPRGCKAPEKART